MSRPLSGILQPGGASMGVNPAPQRQMNLTEELERLEQSITLTMQEIDRNFSQCHRIITHSIMPIVDKYAEHSRDVCNNIAFWKSFFEDSADIALGGYAQEGAGTGGAMSPQDTTTYDDSQTQEEAERTEVTVTQGMDMTVDQEGDETGQLQDGTITLDESDSTDHEFEEEDESILASMNLSKARRSEGRSKQPTKWAAMQSPFDKLKKEFRGQQQQQTTKSKLAMDDSMDEDDESMTPPRLPAGMEGLNFDSTKSSSAFDLPTTPEVLRQKPSRRPAASRVLDSFVDDDSPFAPQTARQIPASKVPTRRADPILHQTADTNWRIQATPHKTPRKFATATVTPKHRVIPSFQDSSPMSSPPPPQITTVFSPVNTTKRFNIQPRNKPDSKPTYQPKDPKTPVTARKNWEKLDPKTMTAKDLLMDDDFDDDDDDDDFKRLGFSPPVTMQFTLPPSKLMQTPAKQASKMLVNDIMRSAGFRAGFAGGEDTQTTADNSLGDSPSMFRGKSPDFDFDD